MSAPMDVDAATATTPTAAADEDTSQSKTEKTTTGPIKRFEVKKWNAVALWAWDIALGDCAICHNHIMDLCIRCQANQAAAAAPATTTTTDECTVAWGVCNHTFHFHCIDEWLKSRRVCPLDNSPWEYLKYGR